jgi:hypothetical protein
LAPAAFAAFASFKVQFTGMIGTTFEVFVTFAFVAATLFESVMFDDDDPHPNARKDDAAIQTIEINFIGSINSKMIILAMRTR